MEVPFYRKTQSSKTGRILSVLVIGIAILVVAFLVLSKVNFSKRLPNPPDSKTLTAPIQEQIAEASEKARRKPTAENLGNLGMVYHASAYYEKAADCYKLAIRKKRSEWKWHYYLGYLYLEMGESSAVIERFKKVLQYNPQAYHAWYYIGEEYHNLSDGDQAIEAFGKIPGNAVQANTKNAFRSDYFPLSVYAKFQLARVNMENKQFESSKKILHEIVLKYPSYGPAYRLLGNLYNLENNPKQSQRFTDRANDLAIFTPPVDSLIDRLSLISRSELYLLKKIDEAENGVYPEWAMRLMINGYKYLPGNKYLISKFIKLYLMMNFGNQASPLLDEHRVLFNDDYNEISNVAFLLYDKGLYEQSLAHYRLARRIKPGVISTHKDIILCIWQTGGKKVALDSTLKWLDENPGNPAVLTEGVGLLLNLKEKERTRFYFNQLKRSSLLNADIIKLSGKIAESEGNFTGAIKWYEEAYGKQPEDFSNVQSLTNLLLEQKFWGRGIQFMKDALVHHPGEPFLLERLGTVLISCPDQAMRNITEGKEYAERAFYHKNSKSFILASAGRSLAMAQAMLGDRETAYSTLQVTIKIAKREGLSKTYITELEGLLKAVRK
jgi:tetratricopeptide (TPR) repeat protein